MYNRNRIRGKSKQVKNIRTNIKPNSNDRIQLPVKILLKNLIRKTKLFSRKKLT